MLRDRAGQPADPGPRRSVVAVAVVACSRRASRPRHPRRRAGRRRGRGRRSRDTRFDRSLDACRDRRADVAGSLDRPSRRCREPPAASLPVEGGDPVVGDLGSFTWMNGGSDFAVAARAPDPRRPR